MSSKESSWSWIDSSRTRLTNMSDLIWGYAELGLMEHRSSKVIADELEKHGFGVQRGVAGMPTAFTATWGSGRPVIGLMGEYDALPGISQKPVPFREPVVDGAPGHGCGHNIHGITAMAAAIAIKTAMAMSGDSGTIRFYGTPAEENYDGKVLMVRAGLFDDIDACLSHHPGQLNTARMGSSNAVFSVKFHFHGKSAHAGGSPEQGRSALDALELMNTGVNYMREHVIDKSRIHYVTEAGGGQPNVVPDYSRSWYYVRAPERDQLENIYEWILRIAKGAEMMTGTTHQVEFIAGCSNLIPNKALGDLVLANMREIVPPNYTSEELDFAKKISQTVPLEQKRDSLRKSNMPRWERYEGIDLNQDVMAPWDEGQVMGGSTDVSDVSWKVPTMEFGTTAFVLGSPGHSWQSVACSGMSIGHKSLIFAAKTMAGAALDLLRSPELLIKAKEEHANRVRGRLYRSPIPDDVPPPLDVARLAAESLTKRK